MGLKNRRVALGISRADLASQIGVNANTVWRYEKGEREPCVDILKRIAEIFGCTIDDLVNPTSTPVGSEALQGEKPD